MRARPGATVLEIGRGSGRNFRALASAGFVVVSLRESQSIQCAGALSTHALLHGTPSTIAGLLNGIATRLEPQAPFFATFGSVRDARYGTGRKLGPTTFAPEQGDEAGVPHTFFTDEALRTMLQRHWVVESLVERIVDDIAGGWAHRLMPLHQSVHYFATLARAPGA